MHGKGKMTWSDGTFYEGGFVNGKTEGHGVRTYPNGDKITGQFKNDKKHGPAVLYKASEMKEMQVEYKNDVLVKNVKGNSAAPFAEVHDGFRPTSKSTTKKATVSP